MIQFLKGGIAFYYFRLILVTFLPCLAGVGCVGKSAPSPSIPVHPRHAFAESIEMLLETLSSSKEFKVVALSPFAVMPGSLRKGIATNGLEEYIIRRLKIRLRKHHDGYPLSIRNWFEYREGRSLTFHDRPTAEQQLLRELVIFEVMVHPVEAISQVAVHITASNTAGRLLPGILAETVLPFVDDTPARKLFNSPSTVNPFPFGLEENPYPSIDQLAFGLAAELAGAYRSGITVADQQAAPENIQVQLYTKPSSLVGSDFQSRIQNALQQAIVKLSGFPCAVSREDFGPLLSQIDFYQENQELFELERLPFNAGTVLLMAEISRPHRGNKIGVALRALWRVGPLESSNGELISNNMSGSYLSGFTSKRYMTAMPEEIGQWNVSAPSLNKIKSPYNLDACFYSFPPKYEGKISKVINDAPGVVHTERFFEHSDDSDIGSGSEICYSLKYKGNTPEIAGWLRKNLRFSKVLPFQLEQISGHRINLYYDGGYRTVNREL